MKNILLTLSAFAILLSAQGQAVNDSVSLNAGYTDQVFYNLNTGIVQTSDNTNWDLGFGISGFMSEIRINDGNGVNLYLYPNGDTGSWNTIDTNGMSQWKALFNTDTNWQYTAFNRFMANDYDLGWGVYNPNTHIVSGDSVYIIQLTDGTWRKFRMDQLNGGSYFFTYAYLDGSNEVNASVKKSDYSGKTMGYFSIVTGTALDREPAADTWDLTFTKYASEIIPGSFYPVTGVLMNTHIMTAKLPDADVNNVHWFGHDYTSHIGTIGYDWKYFDMDNFEYVIEDSLVYFSIDTLTGDVWKLIFTGFEGSTTGNMYFSKERVGSTGIESIRNIVADISVYPNPASDFVNIAIETKNGNEPLQISIFDLQGKTILEQRWNNEKLVTLPINHLVPGVYLIRIGTQRDALVKKLIIN